MRRLPFAIAALLLLSGLCALVYQTVWLRTFRLVFGTSTPATAAVLAIFMGGLGFGALKLSRFAEEGHNPLRLYARLELGIAATAGISPLLLDLVRWVYLAAGGTSTLGTFGATALRLLLAPLVIGIPVFLMGGTLPAAARAATRTDDLGRRGLALLYGLNAVGAVAGVLLSTFVLFEAIGLRATLWSACLLNGAVGLVALRLSGRSPAPPPPVVRPGPQVTTSPEVARRWILVAAFATGFSFLLSELVWYRLSAPILGGTTYSFGLILAFALAGVGAGGVLYAWSGPERPTPGRFALTCALEALLLLLPYALGDELALLAYHLRGFADQGFAALVATWGIVAGVMVFPAALVAGYQFPLLLSLKGRGAKDVAVDVGEVYAANTVGAILGSLAGGFGLLPLLTAPGAWKVAALVLIPVGLPFARRRRATATRVAFAALSLLVGACLFASGPGALWRHSGIGAGRAKLSTRSWNETKALRSALDRRMVEEFEGRESSVGVSNSNGLVFFVNGKSDGHVVNDAPTMIFLTLIGAILHPNPENTFVIGLGGGQSAGWLAQVPSVKHVEIAELEPAVLRFANRCEEANFHVLDQPNVHVTLGDAREILQTSSERYDLIGSEPSNPYRAGVSSLFTADFYREVRARLNPGGLFLQWLQCYDVDAETVQLCMATVRSVFPHVSVWLLDIHGDILLVAANEPLTVDAEQVRARLEVEPFRSAFGRLAGVYDVEGVLSRFIAGDGLARRALEGVGDRLTTDDHPRLEFRFARSVGRASGVWPLSLATPARALNADRPEVDGSVDWDRVALLRTRAYQVGGLDLPRDQRIQRKDVAQAGFWLELERGQYARAVVNATRAGPPPAHDLYERRLRMKAQLFSTRRGMSAASLEQERRFLADHGLATDMAWLQLQAMMRRRVTAGVAEAVEHAARLARGDPLADRKLLEGALEDLARGLQGAGSPAVASSVARTLAKAPFALHIADRGRRIAALNLAAYARDYELVASLSEAIEPTPLWTEEALRLRVEAYEQTHSALLQRAKADLREFLEHRGATVHDLFGR